MGRLNQRRILVAISGGIAAYKGAELVRLLKKHGGIVRVILSRGAQEFITPLTLQALSGFPTHTELLDENAEAGMSHIELARWADLMVIAPATADVIARLAQGRADDLLTTVALATRAPLAVAPAMNREMWTHSATQNNLTLLIDRNVRIIGPDVGDQACGEVGPGRLLEPEDIVTALSQLFEKRLLAGNTVVITAGPTREKIDPVRFLSNHSSGKMGYALAEACAQAGAQVTLISGPTEIKVPPKVDAIFVVSAVDMFEQAMVVAANADIFIGAAAVADHRPEKPATEKLKKGPEGRIILTLLENPDIVARVANMTDRPPLVVGFAAETEGVVQHARAKRLQKGLDLIVANNVSNPETTFGSDNNSVLVIGEDVEFGLPLASKRVIATQIVSIIANSLIAKNTHRTQD